MKNNAKLKGIASIPQAMQDIRALVRYWSVGKRGIASYEKEKVMVAEDGIAERNDEISGTCGLIFHSMSLFQDRQNSILESSLRNRPNRRDFPPLRRSPRVLPIHRNPRPSLHGIQI